MAKKALDPIPVEEDAEVIRFQARMVPICKGDHELVNSGGGTVTCEKCPYGTRLPGYLRLLDGKIVDLRTLNGE